MFRRSLAATIALTAALGLAGCQQTETGNPAPDDLNGSPSEANGAPNRPVQTPKSLTSVSDPCALLDNEQLATLGIRSEAPEKDNSVWGEPQCTWFDSNVSLTVSPDTVSGGGISRVEDNKGQFSNFEETTVASYPAARTDAFDQMCTIYVGVTDDHTIGVNGNVLSDSGAQIKDPCKLAENAAIEALKNIPPQP